MKQFKYKGYCVRFVYLDDTERYSVIHFYDNDDIARSVCFNLFDDINLFSIKSVCLLRLGEYDEETGIFYNYSEPVELAYLFGGFYAEFKEE